MQRARAAVVVYRARWLRGLYIGLACFLAVSGSAFVVQPDQRLNVALRVVGIVFLAVASLVGVQAASMGVFVTPDDIVERTLTRTRRFRWSQIERFGTTTSWDYSALQWKVLSLRIRGGREFILAEVASPFWVRTGRDFPTAVAAELNARLTSR